VGVLGDGKGTQRPAGEEDQTWPGPVDPRQRGRAPHGRQHLADGPEVAVYAVQGQQQDLAVGLALRCGQAGRQAVAQVVGVDVAVDGARQAADRQWVGVGEPAGCALGGVAGVAERDPCSAQQPVVLGLPEVAEGPGGLDHGDRLPGLDEREPRAVPAAPFREPAKVDEHP